MIKNKKVKLALDFFRLIYLKFSFVFDIRNIASSAKNKLNPLVKKNNVANDKAELPKLIWVFWNKNPPSSVLYSIDLIRDMNPGWEVIFIDTESVSKYLDVDYEMESISTPHHFSDLLRLDLLYKYGGVWIDASVLVLKNLDWCVETMAKQNVNLIGYYRSENNISESSPVMENWFIASTPNNASILYWRTEFSKALSLGVSNYISDIKLSRPYCLANLYDPHYLICYVCFQSIIRKVDSYLLYECDQNAFLYHFTGGIRNRIYNKKAGIN